MVLYEKGLNHLKSFLNQSIGNYQCYAVAAEYSGKLCGPDLGAGTYYDQLDPIGNIYAASDIGSAYSWSNYGWRVIEQPKIDQLCVGAIVCYERDTELSDDFTTSTEYGHCGVIYEIEGTMVKTYEQKGEKGEIVATYKRIYSESTSLVSIIIPPEFEGVPTDFTHGQAQ